MDLGLGDKVALVGGSSRGLGRAIAGQLAAEGAHLVLVARTREAVESAAADIAGESGVRVVPVTADVATPEGVARVVEAAMREFGRVDVLVTNTGGPPAGPFEQHGTDAWRAAYDGLLGSVVEFTRALLPGMKERAWGRIINITSIAVKQPVKDLILSNSIRAAVTGFARTLANEIAPSGVTVNCVMPGYTRTDRLEHLASRVAAAKGIDADRMLTVWDDEIPMRRIGEPDELAALVTFLASTHASYITGQSIAVDGGWIASLL
jgi:3-oxoacyl-[acyl-carrier protein] reductase